MNFSGPRPFFTLLLFTSSFAIILRGATHIATTSVPDGTVGRVYSASLSVTGGTAPYSWNISTGSLPGGLSLSSGGTISGTPNASGTFQFTVKVTGSGKDKESDTQALSLVVSPALAIATSALPNGQVAAAYSQALQASGGTGPYTWSISSGSLPSGLGLSAGQISGTPSTTGTSSFTVKVADANSDSVSRALSIIVTAAPVSITTVSAPNGQVGVSYAQALQASGGTGSYTWSISAGALPSGLSLGSSGQITGTPAISGNASFTVKVNDTASGSATRALSISITAAPVSITTTSLTSGRVGTTYSQTLQASGGTGSYTWSVSSGALPPGLSLSASGHISGTPSAAANASFSVRVSDSAGANTTAALSISVTTSLSSAACPAASGVVGQAYSDTLSTSGGAPPYTWTISSGLLPGGLTLNPASGQISGTPSVVGSFSFVIRVSDQGSASAVSGCTLAISASLPPTISTASLPSGVSGDTYTQTLSAAGGQPPYAWAVSGGALPPGLSLSAGRINGTPTTPGTFAFTLRVSDSAGKTTTKDFTVQIGAALTLVTGSLASLKTGVVSAQQLSASGGLPPYIWTLVSGALPPGVTLSASGLIGGAPTAAGSFSFTVRVTDGASASAERTFTVVVTASLGINACPAPNATQGQSYSSTAVATGGQTPYTWALASGALPAGVVLNNSTGGLSGVPSDSGTYPYTLLITDKGGATATLNCQLAVTSSLVIGTASLPDASQFLPYGQTLSASGGKAPYTWSIVSGSLPVGLTLTAGGTISGMPPSLGSSSFTVSVIDANGAQAQRLLSITVATGLNLSSCSASTGEVGLAFDSAVLASGGTPPYTWSISSGGLPSGLILNPASGVVSGTPSQPGTTQFAVDLRDSGNHATTRQCSMDVAAAVAISASPFSTGTSGLNYSAAISPTGGVPPFLWSTTAGSLPPGLSLNPASGHITGIPLTEGTFAFTAKVIDGMGGQATKDLSIVIAQGLTIPDCPSPAAVVGLSYSALLTAVGGNPPYLWRIDNGALPPGLVLSSENAAISGTPLQLGLSSYVLRVDDANSKSTTRLCSIQINPPGLSITSPSSLPNGFVGNGYSQTLTASGGRAPYLWSITTAGAPTGISLDATGVLSGLAGTPGTFSFTVQVTDQDNNVARQRITLIILAGSPPNVTISGLPDIIDPAQQPSFTLQLDSGYPAAINGTLSLVFTPDPAVGVDDPAVQFATGGRVMTFTVPPNSTQAGWSAPVVAFQSGTVSGNIELDVKLESNGTDITPPGSARVIRVDRLAPRIANVQVVKTSSGFEVHLTGFATTREVTQGTFRFSGDAAGSTVDVTVPLSDSSKSWFQNADSDRFGGQFGLVQSFQWQGQPTVVLNSVSVSLTNAQGASAAVQAKF